MRIEAQTYRDMRRYLAKHAEPGRQYRIYLPSNNAEKKGEKVVRIVKRTVTLIKVYPFHVQFRDAVGINVCVPLMEAIHLLKGERYTVGFYGTISLREETNDDLLVT